MSSRRGFLGGSIAAAAVGGMAWVAPAAAQPRPQPQPPGRGGRVVRAEWTAAGPPDGREPVDPTAPTEEERIHVPVLTLPRAVRAGRAFDLVVRIGVTAHVMAADHRIDWVEVMVGQERAWVMDLGAGVPYPVIRVPLVMSGAGTIVVRARCTQHGVWRTRHDVTM